MLRDVDSAVLADELKLTDQMASIHDICIRDRDPATCNLREVLRRFIHAQPPQSCKNTVEKIVIALDNLGDHYVKESTELRKMFSIGDLCVYLQLYDPTLSYIIIYLCFFSSNFCFNIV